jgi:transcriptional regulator with XRE-family HTH domain
VPGNRRRKLSEAERQKLGKAVRELREGLGWEKPELAERSTLGESTIRQIENATGKSTPRQATLEILSRALEKPPNYLINVLKDIQQDGEPAQIADNATLLLSVEAVRQRLDEVNAEVQQRLDEIDVGMRERQGRAEVVFLQGHQILERRLDKLDAGLERIGSSPDIFYKRDDGEQLPS